MYVYIYIYIYLEREMCIYYYYYYSSYYYYVYSRVAQCATRSVDDVLELRHLYSCPCPSQFVEPNCITK